MFLFCMKRYFSSFRYILGVLGVLFLALLIGGSILFGGTKKSLGDMTENIKVTTGEADLSTARVGYAVRESFYDMFRTKSVDSDGNNAMSGDETKTAIHQSIEEALSETMENYVNYVADVTGIIAEAVVMILLYLAVFLLIQIIGTLAGRSYVLISERAKIDHNNLWHVTKSGFLHNFMMFVYFVIAVLALCEIPYLGYALVCIFPLIYCVASLFFANLAVKKGDRVPMKQVLHIRNIMALFCANLVQLLLSAVICVGIAYIANFVIGLYLNTAFVIIASAATALNSDAIVYRLADETKDLQEKTTLS